MKSPTAQKNKPFVDAYRKRNRKRVLLAKMHASGEISCKTFKEVMNDRELLDKYTI